MKVTVRPSCNTLEEGSLCWGKLKGWSSWPCVIIKSPADGKKKGHQYVWFLGQAVTFGWVSTKKLQPFSEVKYRKNCIKTSHWNTEYKSACINADRMMIMTNKERLQELASIAAASDKAPGLPKRRKTKTSVIGINARTNRGGAALARGVQTNNIERSRDRIRWVKVDTDISIGSTARRPTVRLVPEFYDRWTISCPAGVARRHVAASADASDVVRANTENGMPIPAAQPPQLLQVPCDVAKKTRMGAEEVRQAENPCGAVEPTDESDDDDDAVMACARVNAVTAYRKDTARTAAAFASVLPARELGEMKPF